MDRWCFVDHTKTLYSILAGGRDGIGDAVGPKHAHREATNIGSLFDAKAQRVRCGDDWRDGLFSNVPKRLIINLLTQTKLSYGPQRIKLLFQTTNDALLFCPH